MTYDTTTDKKKRNDALSQQTADSTVPIRKTLNSLGISNDRIGYNEANGTVTLDNRTFMTPSRLDDDAGISYAPETEIRQTLVNFLKDSSDPIVRVSDAYADSAGKYGLSADALTYGNGTVSLGGKPLDILYIDDEGKSWAYRSTVDDAVSSYADRLQVQSPADLAEAYRQRYLTQAESLLDTLQNQKAFSYDPDSDPVYQAYRRKYLQEADLASRDALASYSALTGGLPNSAAATAAAQAEQYYRQQLTDQIPTLAAQAYERYSDDFSNRLSLLGKATDLYQTAYQTAADVNQTQVANANASSSSNIKRDADTHETAWEDLLREQSYRSAEQSANQTAEKNALTIEGLQLNNLQQRIYQTYYQQLLDAELQGERLNNQLTQARIYQAYQ